MKRNKSLAILGLAVSLIIPGASMAWGQCSLLAQNTTLSYGEYLTFPITSDLSPRTPISVEIDFTTTDIAVEQMLWRFGTTNIVGQAHINNGVVSAYFTTDGVNSIGGRDLRSQVLGAGRHKVVLSYDGRDFELRVDDAVVDSLESTENITTTYDGDIWVGRNGYATFPAYLTGTVHRFEVCFDQETDCHPCDVNGDGQVNALDLQKLVNVILGVDDCNS